MSAPGCQRCIYCIYSRLMVIECDECKMRRRRNAVLNRWFKDKVQLNREDTKAARAEVMPILDLILQTVANRDCRFGEKPIPVGSHYQGLKDGKADEFDLNLPLAVLGDLSWTLERGSIGPFPCYRCYGFNRDVTNEDSTVRQDLEVVPTDNPLISPGNDYFTVCFSRNINLMTLYKDCLFTNYFLPSIPYYDVVPFYVKRKLSNY